MAEFCPHCGGELYGSADLVARWRSDCAEKRWPIVADRVSEATAARLLGMSVRQLTQLRKRGCGPVVVLLPVAGSRYSYELSAVARFYVAQRTGEDWEALVV